VVASVVEEVVPVDVDVAVVASVEDPIPPEEESPPVEMVPVVSDPLVVGSVPVELEVPRVPPPVMEVTPVRLVVWTTSSIRHPERRMVRSKEVLFMVGSWRRLLESLKIVPPYYPKGLGFWNVEVASKDKCSGSGQDLGNNGWWGPGGNRAGEDSLEVGGWKEDHSV